MADAMILPPELCDTQEGEPERVTSYLKRSHELIPPPRALFARQPTGNSAWLEACGGWPHVSWTLNNSRSMTASRPTVGDGSPPSSGPTDPPSASTNGGRILPVVESAALVVPPKKPQPVAPAAKAAANKGPRSVQLPLNSESTTSVIDSIGKINHPLTAGERGKLPTIPESLLRLPEVIRRSGLCRAKIYREVGFPKPLKLGTSSRWIASEVDAWVAEIIARQLRDRTA
jgi:prophage regulatory protein